MEGLFRRRNLEWSQEANQFWLEQEGERDQKKAERDQIYKIEAKRFFDDRTIIPEGVGVFQQMDIKSGIQNKTEDISDRGLTRIGNVLGFTFNRNKKPNERM